MQSSQDQPHILGQSRSFMDLMDQVSDLAPLNRPVLVIGERGTGKEVIAARLHFLSRRWDRSFVKLNCAALPETLLESELFGYEPGAFTGATKMRAGRFELADEGSLFLDEIATMSMGAQEKLLRIIEYGEFERVGGSQTLEVDVRVIGAANVDLPRLADEGRFRHDLLDRLAFDVLTVPPLRARIDDIMLLAGHFAHGISRELEHQSPPRFSKQATEQLLNYAWPGNVRELKNVVERAVYKWPADGSAIDAIQFDPFDSPYRPMGTNGAIRGSGGVEMLPKDVAGSSNAGRPLESGQKRPSGLMPLNFKEAIAQVEKEVLEEALSSNRFNQKDTAKYLRLSYDQLRHSLKKHGLLDQIGDES